MEITIQYTGQLAGLTGKADEIIEVESGTALPALISVLSERHGEKFSDLLVNAAGDLRSSTLVILDGEQAAGAFSEIVLDGVETVMLMTPIAGG